MDGVQFVVRELLIERVQFGEAYSGKEIREPKLPVPLLLSMGIFEQ